MGFKKSSSILVHILMLDIPHSSSINNSWFHTKFKFLKNNNNLILKKCFCIPKTKTIDPPPNKRKTNKTCPKIDN